MDPIFLSSPNQPLTAIGNETVTPDGTPIRRFKRFGLQVGSTYRKAGWKNSLVVTEDYAATLLSNWDAMKRNGVPVKVTKNHQPYTQAENCLGDVADMRREGDWIAVELDMRGRDNINLAESNKDISVEIYPRVCDGKGNEYRTCIPAVSFTGIPVVTGQPIHASMAYQPETYYLSTEPDMNPIFAAIAKLSGVDESTVTESTAIEHLAKLKLSLDTATASLATAQGEIKKLSAAPEVDTKYLSLSAKFAESELAHAVADGILEKNCADELQTLCIGDRATAKYSPLMLSMGEESTNLLEKLIGIIRKNKPVKTGEKTPAQHLRLSRDVPDDDGNTPTKVKSPYTGNEVSLSASAG